MKRSHFQKYYYVSLISFFISCSYAQEIKPVINENLDDHSLRSIYSDTSDYRANNIYAVHYYQSAKKGKATSKVKILSGKPFELISYMEYLPDGRNRYKKHTYDQVERTEKYHYDKHFKNLILTERTEENKTAKYLNAYYNWLFYDDHGNLNENFGYVISDKKTSIIVIQNITFNI